MGLFSMSGKKKKGYYGGSSSYGKPGLGGLGGMMGMFGSFSSSARKRQMYLSIRIPSCSRPLRPRRLLPFLPRPLPEASHAPHAEPPFPQARNSALNAAIRSAAVSAPGAVPRCLPVRNSVPHAEPRAHDEAVALCLFARSAKSRLMTNAKTPSAKAARFQMEDPTRMRRIFLCARRISPVGAFPRLVRHAFSRHFSTGASSAAMREGIVLNPCSAKGGTARLSRAFAELTAWRSSSKKSTERSRRAFARPCGRSAPRFPCLIIGELRAGSES